MDAVRFVVPKTHADATRLMSEIAARMQALEEQETAFAKELEPLEKVIAQKTAEYARTRGSAVEDLQRLGNLLRKYAEREREELTRRQKRKASYAFPTGDECVWRNSKHIEIHSLDALLTELKRKKLRKFIRIKEEPNKQAMHQHREKTETLKNASLAERKKFVIVPRDTRNNLEASVGEHVNWQLIPKA